MTAPAKSIADSRTVIIAGSTFDVFLNPTIAHKIETLTHIKKMF